MKIRYWRLNINEFIEIDQQEYTKVKNSYAIIYKQIVMAEIHNNKIGWYLDFFNIEGDAITQLQKLIKKIEKEEYIGEKIKNIRYWKLRDGEFIEIYTKEADDIISDNKQVISATVVNKMYVAWNLYSVNIFGDTINKFNELTAKVEREENIGDMAER
jgi:hypothetical protein